MDRRNFFKLVGTASGGVVTGACGKQGEEIIPLLVPEQEIVPGVEEWRPSVCQECAAGCGLIARVMESEREIEVEGERLRQKIAAVKKVEGNPLDPVSGGRLCARGQASLQSLYNPDRLQGPLQRVGARGTAEFEPVAWEAALAEAGDALAQAVASNPDRILFLTQPRMGTRMAAIARFLEAIGAPPARSVGVADFAAERAAAQRVYGWDGIPVYEIQDATFVLSIGADFLGGWVSPVLYSRRYGHMRQGRPELRGRLVHAESRFSLTAWNADGWLPVWPGGELALALAIGHVLVGEELAPAMEEAPAGVVAAFANVDLEWAARSSGVSLEKIRETATELVSASAPLVVAGASMVRGNSPDAVTAANALNLLLGNVGRSGGVMPPAGIAGLGLGTAHPTSKGWLERLVDAELVLIDGVNPAFHAPFSEGALAEAGTLISLTPFLDDTSAYADLILPDHDPLERAQLVVPDASPVPSLNGSAAFVEPLYHSRATESVLMELAKAAGRPFEAVTVESSLRTLHGELGATGSNSTPDEFVVQHLRQGGWWGERRDIGRAASPRLGSFSKPEREDGLQLQAYPSLQFGDGSGANRPWLQEMPDPTSSAMWGTPVELDPGTAQKLGVINGNIVRVQSAHGSLEAPVYVNPAALPGIVSMAIGQGHRHFGRYASGRGANPLAILEPATEPSTGALVFGPTPVTLEVVSDERRLIQFSRQDRDVIPHRV